MTSFLLEEGKKNVGLLLQQAFQWVVDTTSRQITYTRECNDCVDELKGEQQSSSWVQAEADKAITNGEDVDRSEVQKLKGKEEQIMAQAGKVVCEFNKGLTCCGRLPNVWKRYRIGKKARKCIQQIEKFRTDNRSKIIGVDIPPGEVTADSWLNSVKPKACELESRVAVMNEIIRVLEDDSTQLVGLWGPVGAGKSMLINQVLYRVNKRQDLQRVPVQVPQRQHGIDIAEEIQKQILKKICPNQHDKFTDCEKRAEHIRKWFNNNREKKAVIILDGLWQKVNLDAIGIPNNEVKVCDVILTARDMDLLINDMGLSREGTFAVGPLSLEESTKLFLYIVRRSGQTIDEEKIHVAGKLVKYCGGLPSLIEQQASILTNQRDIYAWHDALREIKSQNVMKMLEPAEETLSTWSSNVNDKKELRLLFSLCGLFGESSFLVRDLIIHCRALDVFTDDVTVKETKDRVKRLLHILRVNSLVSGNNHEVKISELFQEVAILIASEEKYLFMRNGRSYKRSESKKWTKEQLQECTALSIDGLDVLKDHPELKYNNLKMLQLRSNHFDKIGDEEFFNCMQELRGLHLKHIDFKSSCFPSTVKNLENLQTLSLDGCRLKELRHIGKLNKLQILKISGSDIIEVPKDVGNLTDLRLLDMRGCHELQVIEHGVLSNLKLLEELYLDDSFDQWEVKQHKLGPSRRKASLNELNKRTCLSALHVYVPSSTMLPEHLNFEKLEKYRILAGDVEKYSEENVKARILRLDLSDSSSILWEEGLKRIMHRTQSLYLKGMARMPNPCIRQLSSQGFPCLIDLHLQDCDCIEYIVESSELVLAFPNLETLTLVSLKNLRKICNGQVMDESFGRLNAITIEKCHKLENLFDFSLMERISAVKKIEVKNCDNITEIATDDIGRCGGTRKKINWDELCHLSLENLKQIVSFCNTNTMQTSSESTSPGNMSKPTAFFDGELISFPGLKSLLLSRLPMATKILYQNIPSEELSNLQSLTVEGFKEVSELKDILFYSPKTTPQQEPAPQKWTLGAIHFSAGLSCLQAQVDHGSQIQPPPELMTPGTENKKDKKHIALQSKTLHPEGYPKDSSGYQNLHRLIVCGCKTLKFLFTASMAHALPHLTELTIANCEMMKEVMQVAREDKDLKSVRFQELTTLCLGSLENLTTFSQGNLESLPTFSQGNISISFPSLKSLKISDCPKLMALFTDSKDGEIEEEISASLFHDKVSPSFPALENLDICNLNKLERIWQCQAYGHAISSQHGGESGGSSSKGSASKLWKTFLKIKKLRITDCCSLVKILDVERSLDAENSDNCLEAQLNEVYIEGLTNIKDIWGGNDPKERKICYRYLEIVSLCGCQMIESLFPASMTDDLSRLQSLGVKSCDGIKHLIGGESEKSKFVFPAVKALELLELPKLMTFYRGPHCSEWPSLEQLTVTKCDNFKIFGSDYKKFKASNHASLDSQPLFLVNKDSFCRLSTLELSQNLSMKQVWGDLNPVEFQKLKVLKLINSSSEPVLLPIKFLLKSPYLKSLQVHNHHFLIDMMKTPELKDPCLKPIKQLVTEKRLREMELSEIPEMTDLKEALDTLLGVSSSPFRWLTALKVSNCHFLEYLFTYSTAKSLGSLTRLTIENCKSMKVIVASEEGETKDKVIVASEDGQTEDKVVVASEDGQTEDKVIVASEEGKTKGEVIFHKLEYLTLDSLQGLTIFCEENYKFKFPFLKDVTIQKCSKMKRFTHGETSSPNLIKVEFKGEQIYLPNERNLNKLIKKEEVALITKHVRASAKEHCAALLEAKRAMNLAFANAKRVAHHE